MSMLEYQEERYETCVTGIQNLMNEAWNEIGHGAFEDYPPAPNLETYRALDKKRLAFAVTVREDRVLVGYCIFFLTGALHHAGRKTAYCDSIFLNTKHRGLAGIQLLVETTKAAKNHGAEKIDFYVTNKVDFGKVLERLGFELGARVYSKVL
jgi:hypothetical protein